MYCPQCGQANDDDVRYCTQCGNDLQRYREDWWEGKTAAAGQTAAAIETPAAGQTPPPAYTPPPNYAPYPPHPPQYPPVYGAPPYYQPVAYQAVPNIPSYIGWAIATLILCFWPTGIVAVVYASKVGNRLAVGDIAGAQEASRKAKMWCWITFGIGIILFVIAIVVIVAALLAAAAGTITIY
jgi:hypothetical protein